MEKFRKLLWSITAIIIIYSGEMLAGGIITIEENRRNNTAVNKTYIENQFIRMESHIGDELFVAIYNSNEEILYNINTQNRSYVEITKNDLEKIGSKMKSIDKMLEEKLKDLPKEQREMMQKMMQKNFPKQNEIKKEKTYSLVNQNEKVSKWECDKYEVRENDLLIRDVWVADWSNSGLKDEYKHVLKSMEKFFNYFTDQLGNKVQSRSINFDFSLADKGIPVKTVFYSNGEENGSSIVKEIKETELPLSLFIVPSDFTKENPFVMEN